MSFTYWYNEIADIPAKNDKGEWEDLETGLTYADWAGTKEPAKERTAYEEKKLQQAKAARKAAKSLGGKALKGTIKQKAWAEEIRKNILKSVSEEAAKIILIADICGHSKFWIDNRHRSAAEFNKLVLDMSKITEEANELNANGDNGDRYQELVAQHEAIKTEWKIF